MRVALSPRRSQAGSVLVVVMMLMLGILGLGMTAIWLTSGNTQVAANINLQAQALYVAEAGLERARATLAASSAAQVSVMLKPKTPAQAGDDIPTGVDANGMPTGVGAVLVDGGGAALSVAYPPASFGRSAGTATAPTAASMGAYTVWIRNDTAEIRQGLLTDDFNGTVVVRSRGVATDGRTAVVLEAIMVPSSLGNGAPNVAIPPTTCYSGKNACDDNSSLEAGVILSGP